MYVIAKQLELLVSSNLKVLYCTDEAERGACSRADKRRPLVALWSCISAISKYLSLSEKVKYGLM